MAAKQTKQTKQKKQTKGIPQDALFVNKTTFTNELIKKASAMTVSSVLRVSYILFGVGMGIFVFILHYLHISDNLVTILVVLLGLMMVWQGYRLPMDNARRIIAQLMRQDESARTRTIFATKSVFGIVLADDTTYTFAWDKFGEWAAAPDCITLSLKKQAVLIALNSQGFTKGDAESFLKLIQEKITPTQHNAFVRWCNRVCYRLDNWKSYKAQALQEEARKKAEKRAAKKRKKQN